MPRWMLLILLTILGSLSLVQFHAQDGTDGADTVVELSDSEVLVARWQHLLDTTGKLHIPFDPEGLTVKTVTKGDVITACRYNVEHSLHITPDFDYEISSDPRVEIRFTGGDNDVFLHYDGKVTNSEWTGRLYVHDLDVRVSGGDFMSVVRTMEFKMAFNKPIFERCQFFSSGYAFDFKDVDYTIVPVFRDIMTGGGGALRFTSTGGGSNGFHSTSQMEITSWMHNGGNRVGPAFDLRGTAGLVATNIIDEQRANLHPKLIDAGWTGPLSLRISSPYGPVTIKNYWNEWWGDVQKVAPGCWASEIRSDSQYGDGKTEIITLDTFSCGGNGSAAQPQLRIVGGKTARMHNLHVVIRNAWKPKPDRIGLYGKSLVKFEFPLGNGNDLQTKKAWEDNTRVYWEDLITGPTHFPPTLDENVNLRQPENYMSLYGYLEASPYYEDALKSLEPDPIGPEDGSGTDLTKPTGDQ